MAHTLNTQSTKGVKTMGQYWDENPEIVKIFNDIDGYKDFCAKAWVMGDVQSYPFDEKNLYDNKVYSWQMYNRYNNKLKRKFAKRKNKQRN